MARLLVANHDLREYCFQVTRLHASRSNGLTCVNTSTKLVSMDICLHVCMRVCFHRALIACALPVTSVRMPACRASSHLLVVARIYFMHVCMLDAMCVCFHRAQRACALPVTSVCMPARPASHLPVLVIARIYFIHVCMLDAMCVCFHRALLVCVLFSRRACPHARPPYIIAYTRYRKDIFYGCMCARR